MVRFLLYLKLITAVLAQSSLENGLGGAGIVALFADDAGYDDASAAFNLRYEFKPAAVTSRSRSTITGARCPMVVVPGGGFGFTSRMWGLTLDRIEQLEVVLANGTVATASNDVNADLFWAMRGAAPSFGITTKLVLKTSPVPDYAIIFQYSWSLNATAAGAAFVSFQNFLFTDIPSEIGMELVLTRGSESGLVQFGLTGGYYGESEATLDATLEPLLSQLPPYDSRTLSGDGTYLGTVSVLGDGTVSTHDAKDGTDTFYAKSLMTPESEIITLEAATAFMTYLANEGYESGTSTTSWFIQPEVYGGSNSKINSVDVDATSFGSRNTSITDNMRDGWDYGAYYNYPDDRLDNWQSLYYRDHYSRLESLKTTYDPNGVFKFPLTVE
ncbi:hypothetical protein CPB85DRAFT_1455042 [Mucidula mucida]|nr:hypothetical protein CPB85DRAFT_1455042 [Mucidula mucida]